ncbi:MAG: hypothetical protein RL709_222 [Pseudomonadota bacterium]
MNNTAVVFCTYPRSLSGGFYSNFVKYKDEGFKNLFVLFDDQNKEWELPYEVNTMTYNSGDFDPLNFNRPIDIKHRWGNHQKPNYFYAHFRMLLFYLKNPSLDYYWFFDDDVYFDANLKPFLSEYENHKEDFLAIQVFAKDNYKEFPFVDKANERMGSHGHWLDFAPGPGDNYKSTSRHMGCFFPIVRYSNQAMKHLLSLNEQGYYGYSEGFVPTALASDGFSVASMLNEQDEYCIKPSTKCTLTHKADSFTWTWI